MSEEDVTWFKVLSARFRLFFVALAFAALAAMLATGNAKRNKQCKLGIAMEG